MLTDSQIIERRDGIGGSDVPAIFNCGYKTVVELALEKLGELEPPDLSGVDRVMLGHYLEPAIAQAWSERNDTPIRIASKTRRHPKHSFMLGHIDRKIAHKPELLEVKCVFQWNDELGESYTQQIPRAWLLQTQHYLAVFGFERAHFAVLNAPTGELRQYVFERDNELISQIIEAESRFWDCVQKRQMPEPQTLPDALKLYPSATPEKQIEVDAEIEAAILELADVRAESKRLKEAGDALQLEILKRAQDAEKITREGRVLATWKNQTRKTFDVKNFRQSNPELAAAFSTEETTRVFRISRTVKAEL